MYEYWAKITNIVDGDTFDATVDLGFSISTAIRIRLDGIDTPETWRPKSEAEREHGEKAKAFVKELILGKNLKINSIYQGPYNRYGARILLEDGRDLTDVMISNNFSKLEQY